jgi:hypothetical protein
MMLFMLVAVVCAEYVVSYDEQIVRKLTACVEMLELIDSALDDTTRVVVTEPVMYNLRWMTARYHSIFRLLMPRHLQPPLQSLNALFAARPPPMTLRKITLFGSTFEYRPWARMLMWGWENGGQSNDAFIDRAEFAMPITQVSDVANKAKPESIDEMLLFALRYWTFSFSAVAYEACDSVRSRETTSAFAAFIGTCRQAIDALLTQAGSVFVLARTVDQLYSLGEMSCARFTLSSRSLRVRLDLATLGPDVHSDFAERRSLRDAYELFATMQRSLSLDMQVCDCVGTPDLTHCMTTANN